MDRVRIGCNYVRQPFWKIILGVPLIYLPILTTVPFVIIGVILLKTHLKYVGGMEVKPYRDFVPAWLSHRYGNNEQPTINITRWHVDPKEIVKLHPDDRHNPLWNEKGRESLLVKS